MQVANYPRQVFCPDPLLGWKLSPNSIVGVRFREGCQQHIGENGWRFVPDSRPDRDLAIGVYGCSFTYGTGLADEETYCALLQAQHPNVQFLNRGIGGHSTVQNLLQFRTDLQKGRVQGALFGVISDHRFRNVPHPHRMRRFLSNIWYKHGIEHVPVIRQIRGDDIEIRYVNIWQPSLKNGSFDDFLPDDCMLDSATCAALDAICNTALQHRVPIIFALLDQLDPDFNAMLLDRFPAAYDVSTPYDAEHCFLPVDLHPNVLANRKFANALQGPLAKLVSQLS